MKLFKQLLLKIFVLLLFSTKAMYAQVNLVPNPSFEVYDTCPNAFEFPYRAIYHAVPWFQPLVIDNSTDYFNPCNTDTLYSLGSPYNLLGYQQGKTGVAYAGIATGYLIPQNNAREYIEVALTDSLISNKKYCISFYVSFANLSQKAVDGMGAYLSKDSVLDSTSFWGVLSNLNPQIENPQGNILNDTLNWVQISGEFYASGGEKYITIGNFKDDAHTAFIQNTYRTWVSSYYYIDDVSVVYCDVDAGINEETVNDFTISPNPAFDILTLNNLPNLFTELFLFDVRGRVCKHLQSISGSQLKTIDLDGLLNGMYFIKIVTENGTITIKFVKE